MASKSEGKEKTTSYLLRLTPMEKSRWHKMASFYALPLAEFIRRRVEGRPITPPKVPAINAKTSVRMGQFDLELRRLNKDFNRVIKEAIANNTQLRVVSTNQYKELVKTLNNIHNLLLEVREELRGVRLQLSGVDEDSEDEEITNNFHQSEFEQEDWD
ncbi:MAG TPA: hypothetical protein V6D15_25880 [Oculatellaceae cyanobacterium]|jgi:hypothetical protein